MSHFLSRMVFFALAAVCPAALAADDLQWIAPEGQGPESTLTSYGPAAPSPPAGACSTQQECGACDSCNRCGGCGADCDECPRLGMVLFGGLESFRGVSDGTYQSNFGIVNGFNMGIPLGDSGFGWQFGLSYGIYDFEGRVSSLTENSLAQEQVFVTTGFFRKANNGRRLSFGLVYDWMINDNWGVASTEPTLGQWRGQVEWALSPCNAVGFWATGADRTDSQLAPFPGFILPRRYHTRAIEQANVFFHHKFQQGADGRIWVGLPKNERLSGDGSLGEWTAGCQIEVPLSCRVALYAGAQYMKPSASADNGGSTEEGYDIAIGLAFYPGRNASTQALNGGCSVPYMGVANNATFLVDQFPTY